jgi:hypothetical protein
MAYINTDRTGEFLLAVSYVGAKLAIYPINAQRIVEAKRPRSSTPSPRRIAWTSAIEALPEPEAQSDAKRPSKQGEVIAMPAIGLLEQPR